jgi:hypothetical protein
MVVLVMVDLMLKYENIVTKERGLFYIIDSISNNFN